jgi:DNA-binding GntR family transcriptional regulator
MARYRAFTNQSQLRRSAALEEHRGILDALVTGDANRACALAQAHVLSARDTALNAIGERLPQH